MKSSVRPLGCRILFFVSLVLGACGHRGADDVPPTALPEDAAPDGHPFGIDMFDDFEDGDRDVLAAGGRFGHWWNYPDGTDGTSSVAVVALDPQSGRHSTYKAESKMAFHVQASGYTSWGSGFSADVNGAMPYDVHAYTGLALWIKNLAPQPASIRVRISDVNTDKRGGVCDPSPDAPPATACYDAFGKDLDLANDWQLILMPFWSLRQLGFGLQVPSGLETGKIFEIAFVSPAGVTYDYYVDDIAFYTE